MAGTKQLFAMGLVFSLIAGAAGAQQPSEEAPAAEAAQAQTLQETAPTQPEEGFGATYGEMVARQQEAIEAAQKVKEQEKETVLAPVPQDSDIDYGSIAAAVFSQGETSEKAPDAKTTAGSRKNDDDIVMTLTEPTSEAELGMGRTIEVKLRTSSNLNWNFDKEYKSLEYLSSRTEDGFFHIVLKAKAPGKETIYFDCLDASDPLNVRVLETKMITISVGE